MIIIAKLYKNHYKKGNIHYNNGLIAFYFNLLMSNLLLGEVGWELRDCSGYSGVTR